ncbi:MAG: hypothetical protein AMXMBFR20_27190 [Planctomycetia bacterium]
MSRKLRSFGLNHDIEIHRDEPATAKISKYLGDKPATVRPFVRRIAVRVPLADVWQPCRAKQCIGDRMQNDVTIAVRRRLVFKRDIDAAQSQGSARNQAMKVGAQPNPMND